MTKIIDFQKAHRMKNYRTEQNEQTKKNYKIETPEKPQHVNNLVAFSHEVSVKDPVVLELQQRAEKIKQSIEQIKKLVEALKTDTTLSDIPFDEVPSDK